MLRKALAIILVYSILVQGGTKLGIYAYFELNKKYIAEVLCINKDKPMLNCNGKCFLAQKIKAQEENEKKGPAQIKSNIEFNLFYSSAISFSSALSVSNDLNPDSYYLLKEYPFLLSSVFHPPSA